MANIVTERKEWYEGLKRCGMYFEGFVDGEKVAECLENHRRDTASTFGTRSSRHAGTCSSQTVTENVSCISIHKKYNKLI